MPACNFDPEALSSALSALGMLYGGRERLAAACAGASSDAEAIRLYIERERPQLLACYDLDTLVELVRAASRDQPPSLEQYSPR
jgi:hypothetical protein